MARENESGDQQPTTTTMSRESDRPKPRPIDKARDSAGSARIPPECGNIVTMKVIGDRMFLLAERCLSSGVFADQIDPRRTNPSLPQVIQQKELSFGVEHLFVRKTVGAAFELADQTHLPEAVGADDLLSIVLDAASSLASVVEVADELRQHQVEMREASKARQLTAAYLPRTPNIKAKVRQCLAALRDVEISVKRLVTLFYPKDVQNESWDAKVKPAMTAKHGDVEGFEEWRKAAWRALNEVAHHRHAMIHPAQNKSVTIHDYELQANGALLAPTIEIAHEASPVTRRDIVEFLDSQVANIAEVVEAMLGYLCDLNARNFLPIFETSVTALPDGEHRNGSHLVWTTTAKSGAPFGEKPILPPSDAQQ